MALKLVSTLDPDIRAQLSEKYKDADKEAGKQIIIFGIIGMIISLTNDLWGNALYASMLTLLLHLLCIWIAINVLFLFRWPAVIFYNDL